MFMLHRVPSASGYRPPISTHVLVSSFHAPFPRNPFQQLITPRRIFQQFSMHLTKLVLANIPIVYQITAFRNCTEFLQEPLSIVFQQQAATNETIERRGGVSSKLAARRGNTIRGETSSSCEFVSRQRRLRGTKKFANKESRAAGAIFRKTRCHRGLQIPASSPHSLIWLSQAGKQEQFRGNRCRFAVLCRERAAANAASHDNAIRPRPVRPSSRTIRNFLAEVATIELPPPPSAIPYNSIGILGREPVLLSPRFS